MNLCSVWMGLGSVEEERIIPMFAKKTVQFYLTSLDTSEQKQDKIHN